MAGQIIISIGREFGSGGHAIGEKIAKDLGIEFVDRKMLDEIAEEKNIQVEYLEKFDEKPRKVFMSRRVGAYSNSLEEIVADMQFDYIRQKADSGKSFVIVGRCAETVLKDRENLISIFILGDKACKQDRIKERYQLNDMEAVAKMARHDRKRKQYHNRHSDWRWGDSRYYDLCINSSDLDIDGTAAVLENYIKARIAANESK